MLFWRKFGYSYWIVVLVLILFEACNTKGQQDSLDEKKNWSIEILISVQVAYLGKINST